MTKKSKPRRTERARRRERTTVVDLAFVEISRFLPAQREAARTLRAQVVGEATNGAAAVLAREAAQARLEAVHSVLVDTTINHVQRRSPAEWLFYVRRFSSLFAFNERATTEPYCRALAEILTLRSTKPAPADTYEFDRDEGVAQDLAGLAALIEPIYEIHSAYRWVGKGASLQFEVGRLPTLDADRTTREAVEVYDARHALGSHSLAARAGLHHPIKSEINLKSLSSTITLAFHDRLSRRYVLVPTDLAGMPFLADHALPETVRWPGPLVDVVALLWTLLRDGRYLVGVLAEESSFPRAGYLLDHRARVIENLASAIYDFRATRVGGSLPEACIPADAAGIYRRLSGLQGSVWPVMEGSPIRELEDGRSCFVDLVGATQLLTHLLERPRVGGDQVNRYAVHFEDGIQTIIDRSAWRPSEELRRLRRRTLNTSSGVAVTDIDAVGELGETVLLVSGKSVPYSAAYDRGEYGEVRNRASDAVTAAKAWAEKVETLRSAPVGRNYDLARFRRFVGPVVMPFVPFVPAGEATAELSPGLRAVSSTDELIEWLKREAR